MTKEEVAKLCIEGYKQALIDMQKLINDIFDESIKIYVKQVEEFNKEISNNE